MRFKYEIGRWFKPKQKPKRKPKHRPPKEPMIIFTNPPVMPTRPVLSRLNSRRIYDRRKKYLKIIIKSRKADN